MHASSNSQLKQRKKYFHHIGELSIITLPARLGASAVKAAQQVATPVG
jgi:hypothetical protein